jgi:hypothetical protein
MIDNEYYITHADYKSFSIRISPSAVEGFFVDFYKDGKRFKDMLDLEKKL